MTTYKLDIEELRALKGKTILITGAATGIGRATAIIAHRKLFQAGSGICHLTIARAKPFYEIKENGAKVAFGDWNIKLGQALADELKERVLFHHCNVSKWVDVLTLFEKTWKAFGTIHAVLGNAGISKEDFNEDKYDKDTGMLEPPDLGSINVNLVGQLYTVKCALHYFKKWPDTRCQIVLTGSAASFLDTPPLHLYCAGKAGILGFMRSLRTQVVKRNVTINMAAPWLTETPMSLPAFMEKWGELPLNQPEGVAHALLLPVIRPEINGKSLFVAGHQIVDFEEKLHETQPLWMGERLSKDVDEGQRRLIT